jgi:hypothetical protein
MPTEKRREIAKKTLINRLNFLNFTDSELLVNLAHTKYGSPVSLRAKPLPCLGDTLECLWVKAPGLEQVLKNYRYVNFILPDTHQSLLVEAVSVSLSDERIILRLPETCLEIDSRHPRCPKSMLGHQPSFMVPIRLSFECIVRVDESLGACACGQRADKCCQGVRISIILVSSSSEE